MEATKNAGVQVLNNRLLVMSVFLFVIALALFDKMILGRESDHAGLLLACLVPLLIVAYFLYRVFIRRNAPSRNLILSVLLGVPVSLLGIISALSFFQQ
jgi:ABC-type iron transport system FetAB permease component